MDLVINNIQFLNLYTGEMYPAEIGISCGRVVAVATPGELETSAERYHNGEGHIAVPGFIDTHVHIESSLMEPRNFCRTVLPHGTTTVMADPHEIANVMGMEGIRYMLNQSTGLPMDIRILAPSCVPSVVGLETSKATFDAPEIEQMLREENVVGLGEVMDYPGVIKGEGRMMRILEVARRSGKFIQGHAPGVLGRDLDAYMAAGCESDHETHDIHEGIEKLRAGCTLECRYGSACFDLEVLAQSLAQLGYPENATICTDDRDCADLLHYGHIDAALRAIITGGMDPLVAIKMCTLQAARLARLYDRGVIKPGLRADIVLLDNMEQPMVCEVFVEGQLVARNGRLTVDVPKPSPSCPNTILIDRPIIEANFLIKATGDTTRLNVISVQDENVFLTKCEVFSFPSEGGYCRINEQDGFATLAVFERHGVNGNRSLAPVKGCGLRYGAVATTVSHDSHNLFVVGKSHSDMALAAQKVCEMGGGLCCVLDGKVLAKLELPVAGLMSLEEAPVIIEKMEKLQSVLRKMGIGGNAPLIALGSYCLAVIPEVRISDIGLIDTVAQTVLPLYAD